MQRFTQITKMTKFIDEVLISTLILEIGITKVANVISQQVGNRPVTLIPILTGGMYYATSLSQYFSMPLQIWPIACSSYKGTTKAISSPKLMIPIDEHDLRFENVLIVDDIFDTGKTMAAVVSMIKQLKPKRIITTTLLKKISSPTVGLDIVPFTIPDVFVVGCGLDYKGLFRNLPYIATLKEEYLREQNPL